MPIRDDELPGLPISFEGPNEVTVLVGPCTGKGWQEKKIPLDGHHYRCGGTIIFRNGIELRACLSIQTHTFDFLEHEGVYCHFGDAWYQIDEPDLYEALEVRRDEAFPYKWLPDRPLDYHRPGPHSMKMGTYRGE